MKRAKIMLMSIAVLAVVGGALAFKAKKFGATNYCYTTTNVAPIQGVAGICPSLAIFSSVNPPAPAGFYTTTTGTNCAAVTQCANVGAPNAQ